MKKEAIIYNGEKTVSSISGAGGASLVAQWLRFSTPNAGGLGSISDQGTRSHMHAATKSSHATAKELECLN